MRNPKPQKCWGITYCNSEEVMPYTIRRTRKEAIADFLKDDAGAWDYPRWREYGCRAVKVIVQPGPSP